MQRVARSLLRLAPDMSNNAVAVGLVRLIREYMPETEDLRDVLRSHPDTGTLFLTLHHVFSTLGKEKGPAWEALVRSRLSHLLRTTYRQDTVPNISDEELLVIGMLRDAGASVTLLRSYGICKTTSYLYHQVCNAMREDPLHLLFLQEILRGHLIKYPHLQDELTGLMLAATDTAVATTKGDVTHEENKAGQESKQASDH